jgi:gliding motility-associated-like protein
MKKIIISLTFTFLVSIGYSQLVISNQGGTATAVVTAMVGGGLTVSNATINCQSNAYGTFTNGASTNLGIPSGIVLTTGNVNTLNGAGGTFWSANNGTTCNDAQLGSLEPLADYDCCILEFDVVPSCTTLRIRFVFGSEEYPEWVSAGYNDAFGFFVTGQNPGGGNYNNTNVATLPNNTTIVSIDNVNANTNSAYYVNNSTGTSSVLDAFTTVLTRDVAVTPCLTYHFKLAIADAGDPIFDSGVFIDFLDCVNSVTSTTSTTPATCAGNDGTATANVSAGYPPYSYSWNTTPPQTTATATGLAPGTYTVTIDDAGSCTPPLTQTIIVGTSGAATTPTFNQVPPICTGESFTLANTSTNNITGTWSPAINNTATTNYTFTPTSGLCATTTTMTVTVNTPITPVFTQVAPICTGGTFTLPTTSTNNISGTWSPAIDNAVTTNYTFTPTIGLCASVASMTVTVNTPTTPIFNQVAPICSGGSFTLPTTSTNSITGTWSPAINNTATTSYTFTPTAGQCALTTSMTVTVNQPTTPTFNQWGPYCQNDIIIQVILPQTSIEGITGTWNPAMVSTSVAGNIVHNFTPTAGQCATATTMTVTVQPPITPTFSQVGPFCQGSPAPPITGTSLEGITGVWGPPGINTSIAGTSTYTFVSNSGQCAANQTMTVTVNPLITPAFTQVAPICVGGSFSLPTTSNNSITGTWSPAINNLTTTNYTFTPSLGQCAANQTMTVSVGPPATPTFSVIGPFCQGDNIAIPTVSNEGITGTWSPVVNNTATTSYTFTPTAGQCATNGIISVIVNPIPTITINETPSICVGQSTTLTTTVSVTGGTYSWQPNGETTNQITVSPAATINYSVSYTINGCTSTPVVATVTVNPNIPVEAGPNISICQGEQVTLTASGTPNNTWSGGVIDGASISPNQTTVYYVTGTSANGCITTDSVTITVNNNPIISAGNPQTVCIGQQVNLTGSGAGFGGNYVWDNGIVDGQSFTVNGTLTYTVTGTDANGCSGTATVFITGLPVPVAQFTASPQSGEIPLNVTFTNLSTNANNYTWDFGNNLGANAIDLSDQNSVYSTFGVYTVWLTASNGICSDSTSAIITATANPWLFVPNVFTPNADGANETWMVQTKNMETIELIILNRWGNVMTIIEDLNGGWNGKTNDGKDATDGTYFYKYKAKAINGEEFDGHGFLTLIR